MLITFRNAEWQGVFHEENTPIAISDDRIKAVTIEGMSVVVNVDSGKDATLVIVRCESRERAWQELGRIVNEVNGKGSASSQDTLAEYGRISPENYMSPRFITVEECHDGQLSFGEVGKDNEQYDTTLTGDVLQAIEEYVLRERYGGLVTVHGVQYQIAYRSKEDT